MKWGDILDVVSQIITMVSDSAIDLDIKVVNDVINRLDGFGYTPTENDVFTIGFAILKVDSKIKNVCNITTIPKDLNFSMVDICCGEILSSLKSTGKLDETFNMSEIVNTAKLGDTSITFDNTSSISQQLDTFIATLLDRGERELLCYRKIRW